MSDDGSANERRTASESEEVPSVDGGSPPPPADPFDPKRLRLTQDFAGSIGVQKALLTIPVRKPSREWFVRVNPDESYRITTAVIELKEDDRDTFLVDPSLWSELTTESTFSPRAIFTAMNRQGTVFLWPVRLPSPDGKTNTWNDTLLEAATMAQSNWVRVAANMNLGAYDVFVAQTNAPGPEWPTESFRDLLKVAFRDRFIESMDHPVLKRLRGES